MVNLALQQFLLTKFLAIDAILTNLSLTFLGQIQTFLSGFVPYGSGKEDIDLLESTYHVVVGYAVIFCTILSFKELCSI
jgi:hypothetical protein